MRPKITVLGRCVFVLAFAMASGCGGGTSEQPQERVGTRDVDLLAESDAQPPEDDDPAGPAGSSGEPTLETDAPFDARVTDPDPEPWHGVDGVDETAPTRHD